MMKDIIYIDMDDVLADFRVGLEEVRKLNNTPNPKEAYRNPPEMYQPNFFLQLPVVPGAKEAIEILLRNPKFDVYIATKPIPNGICAGEKYLWVKEHFPALLDKMFLVCDKGHLNGDILIDDDAMQWADSFHGEFLHFDTENQKDCWEDISHYLKHYHEDL